MLKAKLRRFFFKFLASEECIYKIVESLEIIAIKNLPKLLSPLESCNSFLALYSALRTHHPASALQLLDILDMNDEVYKS